MLARELCLFGLGGEKTITKINIFVLRYVPTYAHKAAGMYLYYTVCIILRTPSQSSIIRRVLSRDCKQKKNTNKTYNIYIREISYFCTDNLVENDV